MIRRSRFDRMPGLTRRQFVHAGLAAVLPGAVGCLHSPTEGQFVTGGDPRITARPRTPTIDAPIGPSALGLGVFADGFMYVPESYDAAVPIPLLVALHGASRSASDWEPLFDDCEERGMVLLAIDSRQRTWDRVSGVFGEDVRFLDAALDHVYERVNVDPDRTAISGFSDGASYALSLGPNNGDVFPHLIGWSPGFSIPTELLIGTPRVFVSHGTNDQILPFTNTRDQIVPSLQQMGLEVTFVDYEGGHVLPETIGAAALDWFLG